MTTRELEARRYSRHCQQRRRAKRAKTLRISLLVAVLAATLLMCGLAACRGTATEPPIIEPPVTASALELVPQYTPQSAAQTPTPAPEPKAPIEEPVRHRDDIVTQGRLLSYELQDVMQDCCDEYEVPYALALAMAEVESHFDPDAVSSTGDYGLMQINKINHEWLREMGLDPLTYAGNIEAGIYIISGHLKTYEDTELALMAYNSGPTGARKLWGAGTYHTDYSSKVMTAFEHWTSILED